MFKNKSKEKQEFVGKLLLTKLIEFGKFELFYPVRRIVLNLKRSYEYAKHGYNSYDWDDFHLYDDIAFKIKRMKKFFESSDSMTAETHCKKTAKEMTEVLKLLERVPFDPFGEYYDKYEKPIIKRYGQLRMYTSELENGCSRVHMMRDKETDKNRKAIRKAEDIARRKAYNARNREKKKLFALIAKYIDGWWD